MNRWAGTRVFSAGHLSIPCLRPALCVAAFAGTFGLDTSVQPSAARDQAASPSLCVCRMPRRGWRRSSGPRAHAWWRSGWLVVRALPRPRAMSSFFRLTLQWCWSGLSLALLLSPGARQVAADLPLQPLHDPLLRRGRRREAGDRCGCGGRGSGRTRVGGATGSGSGRRRWGRCRGGC